MQNSFAMHKGAELVDRTALARIPVPEPEGIWYPVAYNEFIDQVERSLGGLGYEIQDEKLALWGGGKRFFGLMELQSEAQDRSIAIGLRSSYDKTFANGMLFGDYLFVCDNLSFCGEVRVTRKNTTRAYMDLPGIVDRAVGKLAIHKINTQLRFDAYQNTDLSNLEADHLIVEMFRARIVPSTYMGMVINEWEKPSHEEFNQRNVWRLYNAVTEALKPSSAPQLANRTMGLTAIMDSVCSFKPQEFVSTHAIDEDETLIEGELA